MDDYPEPDSFEKRLRFGCGFAFGAIVAFFIILREIAAFTGIFWAAVVVAALISGFLAMRYGDRFWHGVSDWFRWW